MFELDEDSYVITIDGQDGLVDEPVKLTLKDLRKDFTSLEVVAALQVRPSLSFLYVVLILSSPNDSAQVTAGKKWQISSL